MSTVFIGVCSHGPGITGRSERAEPRVRDAFYAHFARMREAIEAERPDALVIVAAEHFANFFMNNMPAFAMGMAEYYDGPIEDEKWLAIPRTRIQGNAQLSRRLIASSSGTQRSSAPRTASSISWCPIRRTSPSATGPA